MPVDFDEQDKYSHIGDFGFSYNYVNYKPLVDRLGIGVDVLRRGEDKARGSYLEELPEKSKKL